MTTTEQAVEPTPYFQAQWNVRAMMSARWVTPDAAEFPEYEGRMGHAVLRIGVEAMLPERMPYRAEPGGPDLFTDGALRWHTLNVMEFQHPIVAPPGRRWTVRIDGDTFRLEHVPNE